MPNNFKQIVIGFVSVLMIIGIVFLAQKKLSFFNFNEQKFEEKLKLSEEENKDLKIDKISEDFKVLYNPVGGFRLTLPTSYDVQGKSKKFEAMASTTFAGDTTEYSKLIFEIRYLDNGEMLFDKVEKDFVDSEIAMGKETILYELIGDAKYGQSKGYSYLCNEETRAECVFIKIDDTRYLYIIKEVKAVQHKDYDIDQRAILNSFTYYR